MKRFIFGLLVLIAPALFAQTVDLKNPYVFSSANGNQLTFYNESGTAVTQCVAGDTVVSQTIPLLYDEIKASIRLQSGDSAHWLIYYQFVNGAPVTTSSDAARNEGFYGSGAEALSALQDSINMIGTVPTGAKSGANLYLTDVNMVTETTTHQIYNRFTPQVAIALNDSIVTKTFADARLGYYGVRIVVIGQVNDEHEGSGSTSALLNKWVVAVRRD